MHNKHQKKNLTLNAILLCDISIMNIEYSIFRF